MTSVTSKTPKKKISLKDIPKFWNEVKAEGRKITWPTRKETTMTTIFVVVFAVLSAIYFALVDQAIYRLLRWIMG